MYHEFGDLKILTTESATCKYSLDENLGWSDKSAFSGFDNKFTTRWRGDRTYYVECRDSFGNTGNRIVQSYDDIG
jgi:hypothetical protein